ncbi:RES family NAD+ phosphorylase [Pseudomonas anatoliensis]|uniref:RES family NAD+ phosphorylase n=1 Tax=Pseudomonas anatoliensis TaxID=2710589 RepID=UPI001B31A1EA|nr:RES family NAD+ phosphorylase [Pseudomonas anatoliensis]MBP5958154.1 RES family NAD+ phosphorylase [Pseudomonas anatoliensis]
MLFIARAKLPGDETVFIKANRKGRKMSNRTNHIIENIMIEMEDGYAVFICVDCVSDIVMKRISKSLYKVRTCISCSKQTKQALTPESIADRIRDYLPRHFEPDEGLYPGREMDLATVIRHSIGCSSQQACEVVAGLLFDNDPNADENNFYWREQMYQRAKSPFCEEEDERDHILGEWLVLAHELTHGRRFFNRKASLTFGAIISEALRAEDPNLPGTYPVIKSVSNGTIFYRARVINSRSDIKNAEQDLGPPPKELAANNRMSAAGVPLMYVSGDPKTCISELRPSIGDSVAVAKFYSTADLVFFDFTALEKKLAFQPISIFESFFEGSSNRRKLLSFLHAEIAKPLRANSLDYVVTQALAEFIRHEASVKFDGIVFRSAQNKNGINYVFFDNRDAADILILKRGNFNLKMTTEAFDIYTVDSVNYESNLAAKA